jgi:bacteriocin-like protein
MRTLTTTELAAVSGGGAKPASHPYPQGQHPSLRNPAHAPGESYSGSADKNFGPQ